MTKTILLVTGLQRSGKSTFADTVETSGLGFTHVPLDDYIVPRSPINVSRCWVFDPTLVDWPLLGEHLQILSAGHACYSPKPDWSNLGKRISAGGPMESGPGRRMLPSKNGFVIAGIYAFAFPFDGWRIKRVYIETADSVLAERIKGHAVETCDVAKAIEGRVGRNVGTIVALKSQADLVIDGTAPSHEQVSKVNALLGCLHGELGHRGHI